MDVAALNAFVKVVQTGSFTRAAEALGTQKAYLSRVVSRLEAELGVRLIERSTRALSVTEVGREIFERAISIQGAMEDVERVAQRTLGEPRGVLKLTCGIEFGMMAVNRWIETYLQTYPQASIEADFTGRVVDIVHEGFDLAIRIGRLADSRLAARKLGEIGYGLYASPDYLARRGPPTSLDDLASHTALTFTGGGRQGWRLQRDGVEHRVDMPARLRASNVFTVCSAACGGLGIAQLPNLLASEPARQGKLQPVLSDWTLPTVPVHAVFPGARYLTPKVRAFIDHAASAFAEEPTP